MMHITKIPAEREDCRVAARVLLSDVGLQAVEDFLGASFLAVEFVLAWDVFVEYGDLRLCVAKLLEYCCQKRCVFLIV